MFLASDFFKEDYESRATRFPPVGALGISFERHWRIACGGPLKPMFNLKTCFSGKNMFELGKRYPPLS